MPNHDDELMLTDFRDQAAQKKYSGFGKGSAAEYRYEANYSGNNDDKKRLQVTGGQWEYCTVEKTAKGFILEWDGNFEETEFFQFISAISRAIV